MSSAAGRVLFTRDCEYCGAKDAVLIKTTDTQRQRRTKRFCTHRCAAKAPGAHRTRRDYATMRAIAELLASPTYETATAVYTRAFQRGYATGRRTGVNLERRRLARLAMKGRLRREREAVAA